MFLIIRRKKINVSMHSKKLIMGSDVNSISLKISDIKKDIKKKPDKFVEFAFLDVKLN